MSSLTYSRHGGQPHSQPPHLHGSGQPAVVRQPLPFCPRPGARLPWLRVPPPWSWPVYGGHAPARPVSHGRPAPPGGSRTDDRQLRRHCCVEEDRVAFPPRAGAASATRGKRRRRARASHVCSRSTACSRQVRARAKLEEAAMGTLCCLGICVAISRTISKPWGWRPGSGERVCAGGTEFPAARAASTAEEHLGPGHLGPKC